MAAAFLIKGRLLAANKNTADPWQGDKDQAGAMHQGSHRYHKGRAGSVSTGEIEKYVLRDTARPVVGFVCARPSRRRGFLRGLRIGIGAEIAALR